jgi:hypothetical protein
MHQSNRGISNHNIVSGVGYSHLELASTSVGKVVYTGKAVGELVSLTGSQDSKVGRVVLLNNVVRRANSQYE